MATAVKDMVSGGAKGVKDVYEVKASSLVVDESTDPRYNKDSEDVLRQIANLEREFRQNVNGQLEDVLVFVNEDNKLEVFDGRLRRRAAINLEKNGVPNFLLRVRVVPIKREEAFKRAVSANVHRADATMYDKGYDCDRFINEFGWDKNKCANFFGVSDMAVHQWIDAYKTTTPKLVEAVKEKAIAPTEAAEAAKKLTPEQQDELADTAKRTRKETGKSMKSAEVKEHVRKTSQKTDKKTPRDIRELNNLIKGLDGPLTNALKTYLSGDPVFGDSQMVKMFKDANELMLRDPEDSDDSEDEDEIDEETE